MGRKSRKPIDVDTIVYYWVEQDLFDFVFDIWRGGRYVAYDTYISYDNYYDYIDVTTVYSWTSYTEVTSFSYEEYYAEYSEEIVTSYESSETVVEEMATSENVDTTSDEAPSDLSTADEDLVGDAEPDASAEDEQDRPGIAATP